MSIVSFTFTDKDEDLTGSGSLTDPMGTQSVWQWYGRRLIAHLTEQTTVLEGFNMLCIIFKLYEEYCEENNTQELIPLTEFYLLLEQMFALAVYNHNGQWLLPGIRGLKYQINNRSKRNTIELPTRILGNQLSAGTWGLYRGAAIRARLLDADGVRLSEDTAQNINHGLCNNKRNIFKAIQTIRNNKKWSFNFVSNLGMELKKSFLSKNNYATLFNFLIKNDPFLINAHYHKLLDKQDDYRTIFKRLSSLKQFAQWKDVFESIIACEDVTGTLDALFSVIYSGKDKTIKQTEKILKEAGFDLLKFKSAVKKLSAFPVTCTDGEARKRFQKYQKAFLSIKTLSEFITVYLEVHDFVIVSRGGNPWLYVEGDRIKANVEYVQKDCLTASPGKGWYHDYYLRPFRSIRRAFRKVSYFR